MDLSALCACLAAAAGMLAASGVGAGLSLSFFAGREAYTGGRAFLAALLTTDGMSFFQLEETCCAGHGGLACFDFDMQIWTVARWWRGSLFINPKTWRSPS